MTSVSGKLSYMAMTAIVSVSFILAGCSSPDTVVSYIPVSKADASGRLETELDFSDSTVRYDISLYSRVDCTAKDFGRLEAFPVWIEFVSPSGVAYTETVYIPLDEFERSEGAVHDFSVPYRKGLVPVEAGIWKMYVSLPEIAGLHGIGVILKHNQD